MTDLEFAKVYGWYVLRFKNLLGNQNHKPFRKLHIYSDLNQSLLLAGGY